MPLPPRLPVGERLRRAGIAAWSIIGIILVLIVAFRGLLYVRIIFAPIGLAVVIIVMLNPLINRLERRRVPRGIATFLAYIVLIGSVTLLSMLAVPYLARQVDQFSEDWPEFKAKTAAFVHDFGETVQDRVGLRIDTTAAECVLGAEGTEAPSDSRCKEVNRDVQRFFSDHLGDFTEVGRSVLETLLVFVLAPLLALYVLIDLPQLKRDLLNLIPEPNREEALDLGAKIHRAFSGFLRGQLFVAFTVGVMSSFGFWLIGLPFWLVIGAIAGFFNLVPLIGPFIGGGLGFLVGTLSGGVGLGLKAALVELVVQQLDNHIISPNVMKRTVQLHPATVMLALLAGGALAGFWGILLGVPAVAVAKLILNHFWATRVLGVQPSPFAKTAPGDAPSVVPTGEGEARPPDSNG